MGILCSPLGMEHAPPADIQGAAAQIGEDPGFEYLDLARWVPHAVSHLSQISVFLATFCRCLFFTY